MKLKKRVLSALMCVCLVICLFTGTAMADTTDPNTPSTASTTGSITIQNPSNSEATVAGKTFDVYKIFDAKTSGTNVSYDWHVEDNTELFYDYFYASGTGVLEEATHKNVQTAVNYIAGLNTAYELSQLAESLHIYIESKGYSPCHKVTADNDDTSIVISDLEYGYYLVYDATDLTTNPSAVRSAVMLSDVTKNAVITLKANRPQIEKTVLENDGETYGKGTSTSIGDVVTFKITTAVPSHMHYAKYTYYIEDTMHNGLALKEDSIKVYRNNESLEKELLLENGTDYTIEFPTNVTSCDLVVNVGRYSFDGIKHILTWNIGRNDPKILPTITGTVNRSMYEECDTYTKVSMGFTIINYAASGLRFKHLDCSLPTQIKKGVKFTTYGGKYIIKV